MMLGYMHKGMLNEVEFLDRHLFEQYDEKLLVCAEAATLFSLLKVVYPKV